MEKLEILSEARKEGEITWVDVEHIVYVSAFLSYFLSQVYVIGASSIWQLERESTEKFIGCIGAIGTLSNSSASLVQLN